MTGIAKWRNKPIQVENITNVTDSHGDVLAELQAVEKKYGDITPEHALDFAAENQQSALHKMLDWDDSRAGHKYRLLQMRWIIHNIHVEVVSEGPREIAVSGIRTISEQPVQMNVSVRDEITDLKVWCMEKLIAVKERLMKHGEKEFAAAIVSVGEAITAIEKHQSNQSKSQSKKTTKTIRSQLDAIISSRKYYVINGKQVRPISWRINGDTILMPCEIKGGGMKTVKMEISDIKEVFKEELKMMI